MTATWNFMTQSHEESQHKHTITVCPLGALH